jgi:hypothetical protein
LKIIKAIQHVLEAAKIENMSLRLDEELAGDTAGGSHKLRVEAAKHRIEADILLGKVTPINSEFID